MEKIIDFIEQKKFLAIIIVLVLTTLVYSNIFPNQFLWDDPDFYQNWTALYSAKNIPDLLRGELPLQHGGVYRPLRSIFQLLLVQTFDSKAVTAGSESAKNLTGYHLISLLIHLLAVLAVYLIVELLTKKRVMAFIAALIFGLHPIHTEAITYFTTSIDEIGIVFCLWSIYFYLKSQESPIKLWLNYTLSALLAWLAFFTYEITLVLPLLLILIDLYKNNFSIRGLGQKIKFYLAYFAGVITWVTARFSFEVGSRALSSTMETTLWMRLLTTSKAVIKYIYLLFIPYPLNVYHKIDFTQNLGDPKVLFSIIAIIGLLIIAITFARKLSLVSFSILWFFICLAPISNVIPTGIIMAEKYIYLASIAAGLILSFLIYKLIASSREILKLAGVVLVLIIAIAYGALTYARNFDWRTNETLWQKTLEQRPDYGRVYNNLGYVYYQQKKYDEALNYLEKAKELEPDLPVIYQNLGNIYDELNQYDKAIENYQKVIELKNNLAEAYNNLATVYQKTNQLDQAIENYKKAIEVDPNYFMSYSNLGLVYLLKDNNSQAEYNFKKALEINPNFAQAVHGLAIIYVHEGEINQAIQLYEKSISLNPYLTENYSHLASIYNQTDEKQKALEVLARGIAANPNDAKLHLNLGILLVNSGQLQQAAVELQKVLALDPENQQAKEILEQITK
ncbi:MAG: hypothetical protein A2731_01595 [Candidatus Buchananbacteria bacterium RIFCSPHIGHO2_01_FULL_39_8]|uniref:Uncharacterized protein n=1 Tax=Candidatus Buchananbacteria bacterium RIFCSPHIGHO2_01_FULL_39_8 TaxID=1797533 RepID=A0A1G1XTV8_9BACT|nr:MAG: hypothetical protein A2731_01595 [Candidatus Buchananbacteria bacterium RIFCSPHIGHO2_01_FULL_39_8]